MFGPGPLLDPAAGLLDPFFTSADGRVFGTAEEAVEGSLSAEDSGGYGAGCSQSSENVTPQEGS